MRRRLRPSWPACLLLAIPATLLAVLVVLHVVTHVRHSAGKSACYAEYRGTLCFERGSHSCSRGAPIYVPARRALSLLTGE